MPLNPSVNYEPIIRVSPAVGRALAKLKSVSNGTTYDMYARMNKYVYGAKQDVVIPEFEIFRVTNLFIVTDAIRYGYIVNPKLK